jgi:translation initiation factor IF-1
MTPLNRRLVTDEVVLLKDTRIVKDGQIEELLHDGLALVKFSNGSCVQAEISAKIKVRFINVRPGDLVRCELSPFDSAKARIVEKL